MPPELQAVVDASIVPATLAQPPPMNANGSLAQLTSPPLTELS
jgi:hypothetical protein